MKHMIKKNCTSQKSTAGNKSSYFVCIRQGKICTGTNPPCLCQINYELTELARNDHQDESLLFMCFNMNNSSEILIRSLDNVTIRSV